MGFYKSSSSSTEGSVQTTPPQPGNSLMWGDSALYERVEHVQEQEEPQQDHTQIPSQSFVGLGRSLSLSASSVLNSVTSNASNLLTGGSNGFPCPTPKAAHAPKEGSSVGEEKDEDEDDFEKVRREDAFPPPPSFGTWMGPKLDSALGYLLTLKGVTSAVIMYLAVYWRLKGSFYEGQAGKWEARYREQVDKGRTMEAALKTALAEAMQARDGLALCQEEQASCCLTRGPTPMPAMPANPTGAKNESGTLESGTSSPANERRGGRSGRKGAHSHPISNPDPSFTSVGSPPRPEPSVVPPTPRRPSFLPPGGSSPTPHLSRCLLHLDVNQSPCTAEALQHLTGCVGHVLTSSELVLKEALKQVRRGRSLGISFPLLSSSLPFSKG